jgi:signal transduction histidine kinase
VKRPRRSLRTRLTLLYAVPFLASGAILLSVPILSVRDSGPADPSQPPIPSTGAVVEPNQVIAASAVALAAMLLVALAAGWLVAGRFLRPLRAITATARDISATNLHRRLGPIGRNDELTELAETLDELFARLEASFESQRRFVANAAHELRTPLTAERSVLQVALADQSATVESLRAAGADVLALGRAQERLIDGLLTLASSARGLDRREPVDLGEVAGGVVHHRRAEAEQRRVGLVTDLAPAPVAGDASLVESLVANLVENGLRHNMAGGRLDLTTTAGGGRARLTVTNTGPVVPPEEIDRLFEPFQRLGRDRVHADGHGLGLAIVRAIADAHAATVSVTNRPEGGLRIDVDFPGGSAEAAGRRAG